MSRQIDSAAGAEPAARQAPHRIFDGIACTPTEFEPPCPLRRGDVEFGDQLGPGGQASEPRSLPARAQQLPCRGNVGGVRSREVNDSVAVGRHRKHQESNQVVEMQQAHRSGRRLALQQAADGAANHPIELAAHQRCYPHD